jgi:hypothetical protein
MSKNYSGLTIKLFYLKTPSDQPVASSYVLKLFFDFGQTFFPFFDDLVPLKLSPVPGDWRNWMFMGATWKITIFHTIWTNFYFHHFGVLFEWWCGAETSQINIGPLYFITMGSNNIFCDSFLLRFSVKDEHTNQNKGEPELLPEFLDGSKFLSLFVWSLIVW